MLHYISNATAAVRRVLQHGAEKMGTARIGHASRIPGHIKHAKEHLDAVLRGEAIDPDSGEPNLAHAATRCLIALEALYQEAEKEQAKLPKMVKINLPK